MDNKIGLTITQKQIYDFIIAFHKEEGVYPTVREICKGRIDDQQVLKERASTTSVFKHLHHLKDRGWIERHTLPRGIKII